MLDHLAISVVSASVLYFVLLMFIAVAVYAAGLIFEWRRRR
jgi:hypothetical protein